MTAILQFGTSRFLQAHAALFAHEAAVAGGTDVPITVVQFTQAPERAGRIAAFGREAGYPVFIKGLQNGAVVDRKIDVTSVKRGISARTEWQQLVELFVHRASWVISNVGDTGYDVSAGDLGAGALERGWTLQSYPAMLAVLLMHRWHAHKRPITILPCELVQQNGANLKRRVLEFAHSHALDPGFVNWLKDDMIWINSLVDRIVSEPIDPVGAVAEPYALWAVEAHDRLKMPFEHPSVILTDDLLRYERLKLYILNLGHSAIAGKWRKENMHEELCVGDFLCDSSNLEWLRDLYEAEVIPIFAAAGLYDDALRYAETAIDRFTNPFLAHRISDIAANHRSKVSKRIGGLLEWAHELGLGPRFPELEKILNLATQEAV